jgi:mono/diheme cytochrome c family protein
MSAAGTSRFAFMVVLLAGLSVASNPARAQAPSELGRRVYEKANCVGCHKWHGGGGGGYGGAALSLRETTLERADLIEVIRCGRPATRIIPEMPPLPGPGEQAA